MLLQQNNISTDSEFSLTNFDEHASARMFQALTRLVSVVTISKKKDYRPLLFISLIYLFFYFFFTCTGSPTVKGPTGAASRESLSVLISVGVLAASFAMGIMLFQF